MAVFRFKTPVSEEDVRKLKIGDIIYVTGTLVTARDEAHKRALEYYEKGEKLPIDFEGVALYHCGPIIKKINDEWITVAAGPTTSTRMELFEAEFIEKFKVRIIIGKGGMGKKTAEACKKYGAVYCAFTGGAAVLAAEAIKKVKSVEWLDLGMPEALWVFEVENFGPLTVAIDTYGNNLYHEVMSKVEANKKEIYERLGLKKEE
jgi:fumarate hydratase subunit beta